MRIAVKDIFAGICNGRRDALAKAITLVESTRKDHKVDARQLLAMLSSLKKPTFARSLRLGVAGPPGAGKSTFIENLGMRLIAGSHRVAVIPVDPSSHISGGSILGDKTRMEKLCLQSNAYIRASPTRGVLGGIAEHTADVISLCEAGTKDLMLSLSMKCFHDDHFFLLTQQISMSSLLNLLDWANRKLKSTALSTCWWC